MITVIYARLHKNEPKHYKAADIYVYKNSIFIPISIQETTHNIHIMLNLIPEKPPIHLIDALQLVLIIQSQHKTIQ